MEEGEIDNAEEKKKKRERSLPMLLIDGLQLYKQADPLVKTLDLIMKKLNSSVFLNIPCLFFHC